MKHLKCLLATLVISLICHMPSVMAQDSDMGLGKLSAADESSYREILARPIDPSWLNLKKIQLYKEKQVAAAMLGDYQGREKDFIRDRNI